MNNDTIESEEDICQLISDHCSCAENCNLPKSKYCDVVNIIARNILRMDRIS